jgi:hypothetical protein
MSIKYSVRPLNENIAVEPILETYNLKEALQKVEEQVQLTRTKFIIVSIDEESQNVIHGENLFRK